MDVFVRVTGSKAGAASSLALKIGEDIAKESTKVWKGLLMTVKLTAAALVISSMRARNRREIEKNTKNIKLTSNAK